ncbi:hypothetical protein Gotur_014326 [Gossypium turneri]
MKGGDERNVSMETYGRYKKKNRSKNMLSTLESQVTNLKKPMDDLKETVKETLNVAIEDQTGRMSKSNDVLEALIMTLTEEVEAMMAKIEELEGELVVCRALWEKGYIKNDATDVNTAVVYFTDATLLWCCHSCIDEKRAKKVRDNKKLVKFFLCCGLHMIRDYPEQFKLSTVITEDEAEPVESQRKSDLVDMRASELFISKKVMGVAQGVELQIRQWKSKEDFEIIHLDDYGFVLGLNFLDKINASLIPFANYFCILDARQQ